MAPGGQPAGTPQQAIWISPAASPGTGRPAAARVADALAGRAVITQTRLAVWQAPPAEPYDIGVEVAAVAAAARDRGLSRYHLFGFSAGATVALAAAMSLAGQVQSVAVLEAAVIGDEDWHPAETAFRATLAGVRALPAPARGKPFREMMMRPGEPLPSWLGPPPPWGARMDRLEDMLRHVGFVSSDLASITSPVLALTGGLSHPRFQHLAERLTAVIPGAETVTFPDCSHLSPPQRTDPAGLAAVLGSFWSRAAA